MILSQLKKSVISKRIISLQELAKQFTRSPEVISGMLEHWQRKGVIRKLEPTDDCQLPCQQCKGCNQIKQIYYQSMV